MNPIRTEMLDVPAPGDQRGEAYSDWRQLLDQYETATPDEQQTIRQAFLQFLVEDIGLLSDTDAARFLAEEIQAEDFEALDWESADTLLLFCDQLYTFPLPDLALREQMRDHVYSLLRQVLHTYENAGKHEQLFTSVQITPKAALGGDEELTRLRHLAYRYEFNRVTRNRRILYAYLVIQALLVVVAFPLLFINAENGALQAQVEELTDVEIGDEGYQLLSYTDALYWSIITAASIGYGDITPTTTTGRIIAAVLGTIGVITIGIIAGLALDWITPRRLD
ncbi:MAG: ion channel [Caldilineaceae bacterium]